jgi:hypothetical protein
MCVKCQKFSGGFQGFRGGLKIDPKIQGGISGEVLRFQEEGRCPRNRPAEECPNKISKIFFKKGIKKSNIFQKF